MSATVRASATVWVKTLTQSSDRQAGTTPRVDHQPGVGLKPTMPLKAAGTRPEPAVSVPRAKAAKPSATATAEPLLLPPAMYSGFTALRVAPWGERVPTKPVAN